MNSLTSRLAKLEHAQRGFGTTQHKGAFLVGYAGPEDDEKLAAARAKAEATGMTLVILESFCPKQRWSDNEQVG